MGPGESGLAETVEDIKIPVLKSLVYTTGRGGTVIPTPPWVKRVWLCYRLVGTNVNE